MRAVGKYLNAVDRPGTPGHKTKVWEIIGARGGMALGEVRWLGPWRQYVFSPGPDTLFNAGCLEDMAKFLMSVKNERQGMAQEAADDQG